LASKNEEAKEIESTEEITDKGDTISEDETEEVDKTQEVDETIDVIKSVPTSKNFDHTDWHSLLQKHVSDKGNVNYKEFKKNSKKLKDYITLLSQNVPNSTWKKESKLAYWINAYNALTVDLIIQNYPIKSIKDIKDPWGQKLWKLGGKSYNLNEIEHEILRKMNEPRIHFAIVCASFSCPKLLNKAYTASNMEAQLTKVTKDFLKDAARNDLSENSIKISKIFKWFAKDFKTNGTLIDFLNKYSDITIAKNAKKSFKDYNWDLNE